MSPVMPVGESVSANKIKYLYGIKFQNIKHHTIAIISGIYGHFDSGSFIINNYEISILFSNKNKINLLIIFLHIS